LLLFGLANCNKLDQERVPTQSGVKPHDDALKGKIVTLAGHFRTLFEEGVQKSRARGDSQRGVSFHLDVVPATLDNLKGIHLLGSFKITHGDEAGEERFLPLASWPHAPEKLFTV